MSDPSQHRKQVAEAAMRDSICEAATVVLAEGGFAGVTMDRVAQAADVSKGTLYNYFRDQDDLLAEVVDRAFAPLEGAMDEAVAVLNDPCQTLVGLTELLFGYVEEKRGLGKVLCGADAPPFLEGKFREKHLHLQQCALAVFRRAEGMGLLRADGPDPGMAARLFAMTLHGVVDERILYAEECPPVDVDVAALAAFVIRPWFKEPRS